MDGQEAHKWLLNAVAPILAPRPCRAICGGAGDVADRPDGTVPTAGTPGWCIPSTFWKHRHAR
jgi:hypothetical protein